MPWPTIALCIAVLVGHTAANNQPVSCFLQYVSTKPLASSHASAVGFPVYITWWKQAPERLERTLEVLRQHALPPQYATVVTQFDQEEVTPEMIACVIGHDKLELAPGGPPKVSLAIKHLAAYFDIVRQGLPFGLVIEDDIAIPTRGNLTQYILDLTRQLPPAWDFVMIGGGRGCDPRWPDMNTAVKIDSTALEMPTAYVSDKHSRCTHAYLISAVGAMKMLLGLPLKAPIDWQINHLADAQPVDMFWIEPKVVYQVDKMH